MGLPMADKTVEFSCTFNSPWDIRTLIAPLPGAGPAELMILNLFSGRLGVEGFDDLPRRGRAREEGHLTLFIAGDGPSLGTTLDFSPESDRRLSRNGFIIDGPFHYGILGNWPEYQIELTAEALELKVKLQVSSRPPLRWWANFGKAYRHYSGFGHGRGEICYQGQATVVDHTISLEHGWGGNFLTLPGALDVPAPGALFQYQLGTLPGLGTFALGSFKLLGGKLTGFNSGVFVDEDERHHYLSIWEMTVEEGQSIFDRRGGSLSVPTRWRVQARGPELELEYVTTRSWDAKVGIGRLLSSGARIEGRLHRGGVVAKSDGVVYQEHLSGW